MQIRSELYTLKTGVNNCSKRGYSQCFCQARNTFQKNMTVGKKADQEAVDHISLAYNYFIKFRINILNKSAMPLNLLTEGLHINRINHKIGSLWVFRTTCWTPGLKQLHPLCYSAVQSRWFRCNQIRTAMVSCLYQPTPLIRLNYMM